MAPFIEMKMKVHEYGPILEGRADHVMEECTHAIEDKVAHEAYNKVEENLAARLQHPTGRYQGSIRVKRVGFGAEVSDGGIVYGPWLEGVGSRNFPVTRFRGYHSFRKAQQDAEEQAGRIADKELDHYARRID